MRGQLIAIEERQPIAKHVSAQLERRRLARALVGEDGLQAGRVEAEERRHGLAGVRRQQRQREVDSPEAIAPYMAYHLSRIADQPVETKK